MRIVNKGDTVYYARVHHATGIYEVCELHIRTVYPDSGTFVGVDEKSRQAFILGFNEFDESIFDNREDAVDVVREAEKRRKKLTVDKSEE